MTGIFNLRARKPKLSFVWDVYILFWYFEQQEGNCLLSDITLTKETYNPAASAWGSQTQYN